MKKYASSLFVFFAFSILSQTLLACDFCAVYIAREASIGAKKGFYLGIAEQFTNFGTLQEDGRKIENIHQERLNSSITQILVGYGFTDRIQAQINIPLIHRSFDRFNGTQTEHGHLSGIGDASITANFIAYEKSTDELTLSFKCSLGLKLPTGATDELAEETHEGHHKSQAHTETEDHKASGIHGHDLALGTGSLDFLLGSQTSLRFKRLVADLNLQGLVRTSGASHYRYGNELHWDFGIGGYLFLTQSRSFTLKGKISGEWKGLDQLEGIQIKDTGMKTLYLGPELNFTNGTNLNFQASGERAVLIKNNGLQLVQDHRIRTSLVWRF